MKIVCDACEAKYSIADDKVRGKVFKIRCKKCSNVIVVRGVSSTADPDPPPSTRVQHDGDAGSTIDEPTWHLVIEQEQVGPMTVAEIQQRFTAGEISGETFAWREGLADWLPLAQLEIFASLVGGVATPDDPFAAAIDHAVATQPDGHRDDLFASAPVAGTETAAQKLRGERNESSVLFSLGNLANIASRPAPSAHVASMPQTGATSAAGEGSGLIDIRSMASAYLGGASAPVAKSSAGIGSIDDLPVFGGGGFSEPAVLVATPVRPTSNKLLFVTIGAVALLAIVGVTLVVMLIRRDPAPPQLAAATEPVRTPAATDSSDSTKTPTTSAVANDTTQTPAAAMPTGVIDSGKPPVTPPQVAAPEPNKLAPATAPSAPTHTPPNHTPAVHHDVKLVTPPPPVHEAAKSGDCDEVSCLVGSESACCARLRGGDHPSEKKKIAVDPDLPAKLDASMITAGMANVKARVMACGSKAPPGSRIKVHVKVEGDGHVSNATIESSPDPALTACVVAAVKRATFPKTQTGNSFGIPYSF